MHYCSIEELQSLQAAAPRFASSFEIVRDSVTSLFNAYLRRDLSFSDNVIQYADAVALGRGSPYYIYLDKKRIDKDIPVFVTYNSRRSWDSAVTVSEPTIDYERGRITLYGPMSFSKDSIRIEYAGGYKAREDDETVMDCPAELRLAAIQQGQHLLTELFNNDTGHKESERGRGQATKEKTIEGLIPKVARALGPYRKTFMRVV